MDMEFGDFHREGGKPNQSHHKLGEVVIEESSDESDELSLADIDMHLQKQLSSAKKQEDGGSAQEIQNPSVLEPGVKRPRKSIEKSDMKDTKEPSKKNGNKNDKKACCACTIF